MITLGFSRNPTVSMETTEIYKTLEAQYFGPNMDERDEIELLPSLLRGSTTFVDVGASLGQYAHFAGKLIKGGRIVAVEADPLRYARLKELAAEWENASDGNRYEVIHAAAADQPGRMDFYVTDQALSGALWRHHVPDEKLRNSLNWSKIEVDVVTLDQLFPNEDPGVIKIDVEGAEYRVILGALGLLKRGKTRFLVEVHPWGDEVIKKMPEDLFNLFADYGYDFSRTHRHWHFEKKGNALWRWMKNRAIVFVWKNLWLKEFLKKLILKFGPSSRR